MFGVENLIQKINSLSSSDSLTEKEIVELYAAIADINKYGVVSVKKYDNLPPPENNFGRFLYVEEFHRYFLSNGVTWAIKNAIHPAYVNLYTWGNNADGQLGIVSSNSVSAPKIINSTYTDWESLDIGFNFSVAKRSDGTAWSWGLNSFGQLGNSSIQNTSIPVQISGVWNDVFTGSNHSLAIASNGTAWCWGLNNYGQIGDETTANKSSPVSVVGGFTDWTALGGGDYHTIGLRSNGTLWGWGLNAQGRLGVPSVSYTSSPVSITGFSDWTDISVGGAHTTGIRTNGQLLAWGVNVVGQLGNDSTVSGYTQNVVSGGFSDWSQVSAGSSHTVAIRSNGTAWSWGLNSYGQLGVGTTDNKSSPVSIVGGFTDWAKISAGNTHSAAIKGDGKIYSWGLNSDGQLGDKTVINKSSPVEVVYNYNDWVDISVGENMTGGVRS